MNEEKIVVGLEEEKPTEETSFGKSKVGVTRKDKTKGKKKRTQVQKESRKVNRRISNKKRRATGSKRRK